MAKKIKRLQVPTKKVNLDSKALRKFVDEGLTIAQFKKRLGIK